MNITLSRGEFTRLVELVYMGMDVAWGADGEDGPYAKRYGELAGKIYRLAATEKDGRPEYVEAAEDVEDGHGPSLRLETDSPAARALEIYESHTFWEALITRLAERDADREETRNPSSETDPDARHQAQVKLEEKLEDRYRAEFVKNDLENVFVMFGSDRLS